MRLRLALSLVLLLVCASHATAERPLRVITEDASAAECRTDPAADPANAHPTERCVFVQVTRSRYSNGGEETLLSFSLTENGVEMSGFPNLPFPIESWHFVMDRDGTRAILNLPRPAPGPPEAPAEGQPGAPAEVPPGVTVVWDGTDDFSSRSFSTEVVREKTEEGFTKSRLTEREQQLSANAEGVVPVIGTDGVVRLVTFNTGVPAEGEGYALASLLIRKTISRTRLLEEEPDSFDFAE